MVRHVLTPDADAVGEVPANGVLPPSAREWGRVLDTTQMQMGDVLLTAPYKQRANGAPLVSRWIMSAQERAGYAESDAQWTHAAIYLGDGESISEANFGVAGLRSGVMIRSIHVYADAAHALRVRRPANLSDAQRCKFIIGALRNLGQRYSAEIILHFLKEFVLKNGGWTIGQKQIRMLPRGFVCSTHVQDALTYINAGASSRMGYLCCPAHLSASSDFEPHDVPIQWLRLA